MSRTNPQKKKRRATKFTVLFYGEGQADQIFLKYLRRLFAYNQGVEVKIRKGKGGAPSEIVNTAIKCPGTFNKRIVLIDADKSIPEINIAQKIAQSQKLPLIINRPCLEALLLRILTSKNYSTKKASWCKSEFERKFISKKQRSEIHVYQKYFPKDLLNAQRKKIAILDRIISSMEGPK